MTNSNIALALGVEPQWLPPERVNLLGARGFINPVSVPAFFDGLVSLQGPRAKIYRLGPQDLYSPTSLREAILVLDVSLYPHLVETGSRAFVCQIDTLVRGFIDRIDSKEIYGWAKLAISPDPLAVRLVVAEAVLAVCDADRERYDLNSIGAISIRHGFSIDLRTICLPSFTRSFSARVEIEAFELELTELSYDTSSFSDRMLTISKQMSLFPLQEELSEGIYSPIKPELDEGCWLVAHLPEGSRFDIAGSLVAFHEFIGNAPQFEGCLVVRGRNTPTLADNHVRMLLSAVGETVISVFDDEAVLFLAGLGAKKTVVALSVAALPKVTLAEICHDLIHGSPISNDVMPFRGRPNENYFVGTPQQMVTIYRRPRDGHSGLPATNCRALDAVPDFSGQGMALVLSTDVDGLLAGWWEKFTFANFKRPGVVVRLEEQGFEILAGGKTIRSALGVPFNAVRHLLRVSLNELRIDSALCVNVDDFLQAQCVASDDGLKVAHVSLNSGAERPAIEKLIDDLQQSRIHIGSLYTSESRIAQRPGVASYLSVVDRSERPTVGVWCPGADASIVESILAALGSIAPFGPVLPSEFGHLPQFSTARFARSLDDLLKARPSYAITTSDPEPLAMLGVITLYLSDEFIGGSPLIRHVRDIEALIREGLLLTTSPGRTQAIREDYRIWLNRICKPYTAAVLQTLTA